MINGECCGDTVVGYSVYRYVHLQISATHISQKVNKRNAWLLKSVIYNTNLNKRRMKCRVSICNDGKSHAGTYWRIGSCNAFGCNCDGGCFGKDPKDAYPKFLEHYGAYVTKSRQYGFSDIYLP